MTRALQVGVWPQRIAFPRLGVERSHTGVSLGWVSSVSGERSVSAASCSGASILHRTRRIAIPDFVGERAGQVRRKIKTTLNIL
jgi:hypothetical protein